MTAVAAAVAAEIMRARPHWHLGGRNSGAPVLATGARKCYLGSMQKRTRRQHGIKSRKISVSVSATDLKVLNAHAKRAYGGNVSAVVHEMIATLKREAALAALLDSWGGTAPTDAELQELRDEMDAAPKGRRKRKRAA